MFIDHRSRSAWRLFLSCFHTALRCFLEPVPSPYILCGGLSFIHSSLFTSACFLMGDILVLISPHLCFHSLFLFFLFQTNIKTNTSSRASKPPTFNSLWVFLYINDQHSLPCEIPFLSSHLSVLDPALGSKGQCSCNPTRPVCLSLHFMAKFSM